MFSSRRAFFLSFGSGLILLQTLGCTTYDFEGARQTVARASPAEVRACLGTPDEMTIRETDELLHYSRVIGQGAGFSYEPRNGFGVEPGERRRCDYLFQVGPDGVERFAVRGRTESGLRDDRRCFYRLSRCLGT